MYILVYNNKNNFNNIIDEIIKESHLTYKQFEIILNKRKIKRKKFLITKGAYYRQVKQIRIKITRMFYTLILLHTFELINSNSMETINQISKQISIIRFSSNINNKNKITFVINNLINKINTI